jgi:ammonium transporter, Amt family
MKDLVKLSLVPLLAVPAARRKNVLGTMMHSFILMAVVTVIWAVAGYSLAFGGSSPFIGDLHFVFLNHVGSAPSPGYASTIPQAAGTCRIST